MIKLNGIVASAINEVKSLILGFTEPTICTTESSGIPMAFAYNGKVIHALQKHANTVRIRIPTTKETITAFLFFIHLLVHKPCW